MEKLVFRKSLWEQDMFETGHSEQEVEEYTWPDQIDNLEVEHIGFLGKKLMGVIGSYTILPKWCEIVEDERKCKK